MNIETPILIAGLPRSRTAWCAAYFDLHHDLSIKLPFAEMLHELKNRGDSDSGLLWYYKEVAKEIPQAKWVFIERNPDECYASLQELKVFGEIQDAWKRICERANEFVRDLKPYVVRYDLLDNIGAMKALHQHLGVIFSINRFIRFRDLKVTTKILCQQQLLQQ